MKDWVKLSGSGDKVRWRKPILRVGEFEKRSEGKKFTFEQEHIDYLAESFSRRVPCPSEHPSKEHPYKPENNKGWMEDMEKEGGVLYGIFEFPGMTEDPNIYDVSVNIPIEEGRLQPIDHVALTSFPVVDGLGSFETISCSLISPKEENVFDWKLFGKALGLSDVTEDNALDVISKHIDALKNENESLKLSQSPKIDIKETKSKHGKILKMVKEGRTAKLQSLPLSKASKDGLIEIFCNEDSLALSMHETSDSDEVFESVLKALEQHTHLETGEKDNVSLSDPSKGTEGESYLVADARRRADLKKGQ